MYNVNRKFYSFFFLVLFTVQLIILYGQTVPGEFDILEALKLPTPVIVMIFLALLGNNAKITAVKIGFAILIIHILFGILLGILSGFSSFFLNDGRFVILALGRGAAETAWAFCALIVLIEFFQKQQILNIRFSMKAVIYLVSFTLILLTQTRSALMFLFLDYYFTSTLSFRMKKKNIWIGFLFFVVILILAFSADLVAVLNRSLSFSSVLTGREFIWFAKLSQLASEDFHVVLFGSDLSPKIIEIPEIGYLTADPHNLYLDFIQYYGLFFLLALGVWYAHMVKYSSQEAMPILKAFIVMSLFVSTFRYSMGFYINVILLILPMIVSEAEIIKKRITKGRLFNLKVLKG